MELQSDLREFIELLNAKKVEYLIVGGYAVAFYGYPRYTGDIDFWIAASKENIEKVMVVLKEFGMSSLGITYTDLAKPDSIIQIGQPPFRIDILNSVDGLEFASANENVNEAIFDGTKVCFISLEDLKLNKKASDRVKDRLDLENLP
jgi:predicted nucleotidyltransferase